MRHMLSKRRITRRILLCRPQWINQYEILLFAYSLLNFSVIVLVFSCILSVPTCCGVSTILIASVNLQDYNNNVVKLVDRVAERHH